MTTIPENTGTIAREDVIMTSLRNQYNYVVHISNLSFLQDISYCPVCKQHISITVNNLHIDETRKTIKIACSKCSKLFHVCFGCGYGNTHADRIIKHFTNKHIMKQYKQVYCSFCPKHILLDADKLHQHLVQHVAQEYAVQLANFWSDKNENTNDYEDLSCDAVHVEYEDDNELNNANSVTNSENIVTGNNEEPFHDVSCSEQENENELHDIDCVTSNWMQNNNATYSAYQRKLPMPPLECNGIEPFNSIAERELLLLVLRYQLSENCVSDLLHLIHSHIDPMNKSQLPTCNAQLVASVSKLNVQEPIKIIDTCPIYSITDIIRRAYGNKDHVSQMQYGCLNERTYGEFVASPLYKEIYIQTKSLHPDAELVPFSLSYDDFPHFNKAIGISGGMYLSFLHFKHQYMKNPEHLYTVAVGNDKIGWEEFLPVIIEELKFLSNGIEVYDVGMQSYRKIVPLLTLIFADTPERNKILHILGHTGLHGCALCVVHQRELLDLSTISSTTYAENMSLQTMLSNIQPALRNSTEVATLWNQSIQYVNSDPKKAAIYVANINTNTGYLFAKFNKRKHAIAVKKHRNDNTNTPLELFPQQLLDLYPQYSAAAKFDPYQRCPPEPFHNLILGLLADHAILLFTHILSKQQVRALIWNINQFKHYERGEKRLYCRSNIDSFWSSWRADEWLSFMAHHIELLKAITDSTNQDDIDLFTLNTSIICGMLSDYMSIEKANALRVLYKQFRLRFEARLQLLKQLGHISSKINYHTIGHAFQWLFTTGPLKLLYAKVHEVKHKTLKSAMTKSNQKNVQIGMARYDHIWHTLRAQQISGAFPKKEGFKRVSATLYLPNVVQISDSFTTNTFAIVFYNVEYREHDCICFSNNNNVALHGIVKRFVIQKELATPDIKVYVVVNQIIRDQHPFIPNSNLYTYKVADIDKHICHSKLRCRAAISKIDNTQVLNRYCELST